MFRTSGQSTSTQTKWQLQSPLSMLRKTCILYVSSDPSTWFQTLGRKCKLQIFVFFMKSCSTWEIILIDSKQLKVKKAQHSSVNPLFSHRCVICTGYLLPLWHIPCSICWASTSSAGFNMSTMFILGLTPENLKINFKHLQHWSYYFVDTQGEGFSWKWFDYLAETWLPGWSVPFPLLEHIAPPSSYWCPTVE